MTVSVGRHHDLHHHRVGQRDVVVHPVDARSPTARTRLTATAADAIASPVTSPPVKLTVAG